MPRDADPLPAPSRGSLLLRRAVLVEPGELGIALLAAAYFFFLLASYSVLRPIRDEMGVLGGVRNLAWLFSGTLGATLLLHPFFAALVSRTRRARFIPVCYRFFALNLVGFCLALGLGSPEAQVWIGRAFFVWTSVFNLFVVSVFWGFMVDVFRPDQAKRLFGFIGVGGTLGAIAGAALTASLVRALGPMNLLLVSALLLEIAVWCVWALGREVAGRKEGPQLATAREERAAREGAVIGGRTWDGLAHVLRSPYLASICLFIGFFTIGSTFLYFQQLEIVSTHLDDSGARTALFASIDLAVNVLTLFGQLFLTGRILQRLGLGVGLAFLPALSVAGYSLLAFKPELQVLVVFQVLRRAGNLALMRPSREVLFTVVPRGDKYKAKSFIDTFVYRLGDQVGAWSYTLLGLLGLGIGGVSLAAILLSVAWVVNALSLARRHRSEVLRLQAPRESPAPHPSIVIP